jgi:hypothetical protein
MASLSDILGIVGGAVGVVGGATGIFAAWSAHRSARAAELVAVAEVDRDHDRYRPDLPPVIHVNVDKDRALFFATLSIPGPRAYRVQVEAMGGNGHWTLQLGPLIYANQDYRLEVESWGQGRRRAAGEDIAVPVLATDRERPAGAVVMPMPAGQRPGRLPGWSLGAARTDRQRLLRRGQERPIAVSYASTSGGAAAGYGRFRQG